jgi:hypothetical protein
MQRMKILNLQSSNAFCRERLVGIPVGISMNKLKTNHFATCLKVEDFQAYCFAVNEFPSN